MAKYVIEDTTLINIADRIRYHDAFSEKITPEEMPNRIDLMADTKIAEGEQLGYKTGYSSGKTAGVTEGIEQGKQDAYNAFWDSFQNNGKRTEYYAGFAGAGWTTETFKPKYDIKPSGNTYGMFQKSRINVDLVEFAKEQGIEIDFSNATDLQYGFSNTYFKRIGLIDGSKFGSLIRCFEINPYLKIIDKIILKSDGKTNLSNAFNQCYELEEIRFEGAIGTNVSFSVCPLSKESILSIITHLSGTSSSQTLTLKSSAVGVIDWTNTVIDEVTYNTFDEICDIKPNWTISLV